MEDYNGKNAGLHMEIYAEVVYHISVHGKVA
jgi:hypothetical protein